LPFCFTADTPALAVQVNHNFDQVVEWMELKTGPVGTNTLTTNTVRADAGTFTTLGVANGLPITIEPEIFRTLSNNDTQQNEPIAVANNRRVCFLTGMQVHDTFGNDSEARCHVEIAGNPDGGVGTWMIRYDVDNGALSGFAGPDVECAARCINW
jgi:hypothetical protein